MSGDKERTAAFIPFWTEMPPRPEPQYTTARVFDSQGATIYHTTSNGTTIERIETGELKIEKIEEKPEPQPTPGTTAPSVNPSPTNKSPFDATLRCLVSLRHALVIREQQMIGCDYRSKTVLEIQQLLHHFCLFGTHLCCAQVVPANATLMSIEAIGFTGASRVLKGADPSIEKKEEFLIRVTQQFYALKRAFVEEVTKFIAENSPACEPLRKPQR